MDNQTENKPLVDFSSPKNLVRSLTENRDAINEKVDNFNKKALEAAKTVFNASVEAATKVLENSDRVAGGAIALAAGGAAFLSAAAGVEAIADPQAVKALFGEAPKVLQVLSAAGAYTTFSYLHVVGRNILRRNPELFDVKGL